VIFEVSLCPIFDQMKDFLLKRK